MNDRDAFRAGFQFGRGAPHGETADEAWERFQAGETPRGPALEHHHGLAAALRAMTAAAVASGGTVTTGWSWPHRALRAHYFERGRSLCGRWSLGRGVLGERPADRVCGACERVLATRETLRAIASGQAGSAAQVPSMP